MHTCESCGYPFTWTPDKTHGMTGPYGNRCPQCGAVNMEQFKIGTTDYTDCRTWHEPERPWGVCTWRDGIDTKPLMLNHNTPWVALRYVEGKLINFMHIAAPTLAVTEDCANEWHVFHRLPRENARMATPKGMAIVYTEAQGCVVMLQTKLGPPEDDPKLKKIYDELMGAMDNAEQKKPNCNPGYDISHWFKEWKKALGSDS